MWAACSTTQSMGGGGENVGHIDQGGLARHKVKGIFQIHFHAYKTRIMPMDIKTTSQPWITLHPWGRTTPNWKGCKKTEASSLIKPQRHLLMSRQYDSPTTMGLMSCAPFLKATRLPPLQLELVLRPGC